MDFLKANWAILLAIVSAIVSLAFVICLVYVSSERQLTPLEAILIQIVILGAGVFASYLISQRFARTAAEQARAAAEHLMMGHARSAFRRVKSLYSGLFYLKRVIERHKGPDPKAQSQEVAVIEAVVDQHINTVLDALEDWRDLVPKEVEDLEQQFIKHESVETEDLGR